jgi:hypothetical protein
MLNRFLILLFVTNIVSIGVSFAQAPTAYLETHHYAFSPAEGFKGPLADTLARKLSTYRLILQAEGGSHGLLLYGPLELAWLKFLNQKLGVTCFLGEYGTAVEVLYNHFLQTGDSSIKKFRTQAFLDSIYQYNLTRPDGQKLYYAGVDFERPGTYFAALKALLPPPAPPASIRPSIDRIRNIPDSGIDCRGLLRFNKDLKRSLDVSEPAYKQYFGANYIPFERMVRNNGTCQDSRRNRNPHMAANILALDKRIGAQRYYGEFGEAHTILKNHVLAGLLTRRGAFRNQVAVINLYCLDCHTAKETPSNYPLQEMEADIQRYFLPLCKGEYTFFDLSGDEPSIARYKAYGQFLIIAKGQD